MIQFHRDVSHDAVRNAHLEKMPGFKLTWHYDGDGNQERYFYKNGGDKNTLGNIYTFKASKGLTKAFVRMGYFCGVYKN